MTSGMPEDYRGSYLHKGADYGSDLSAGDINTYMTHCENRLLRKLVPRLFPERVPRYLDFACGTGRVTQVTEPMAMQSLGVDVSPNMLEQARQRCPSTQFFQIDITQGHL
ncbi:MAG: methyltransferase domain-containing protein [Gammaproteobacteria bacterium]|nr:methyltransferase domain-containing protein [Gammaproteobacteria bacterium]